MMVNRDLNKVMKAGQCGCSVRKQNESGVVLGIAILLGSVVLLMAVCSSIHTKHHMKAVNADMDRLEAQKL